MKKVNAKKARIGVIMGGLSSEREISLQSGRAMAKALKENGHKVVSIDIDSRSIDKIVKAKIDVALIALHGTYGEDGAIQGILEFLNIPYAGSGIMASAVGMNKIMTKQIAVFNKLLTAAWQVLDKKEEINGLKIKYPMVFKPEAEGSSVGVFLIKDKKEALKMFPKARKFGKVLAEEYIKGVEVSVPVLGDRTLPIIEIVPKNEFYDYESKYCAGMSQHIIPARLTASEMTAVSKAALTLHRALGCRDYSRIDMIVRNGIPYLIEVNTLPGMTSLSLIPDSAGKAGISFYGLISILLNNALGRKK
jgi:D-alanine-D-alanine ligase